MPSVMDSVPFFVFLTVGGLFLCRKTCTAWKNALSLQDPSKIASMKHLTESQRYDIFLKIQNGLSQTEIAELIGVNKSTISRETLLLMIERQGFYG